MRTRVMPRGQPLPHRPSSPPEPQSTGQPPMAAGGHTWGSPFQEQTQPTSE